MSGTALTCLNADAFAVWVTTIYIVRAVLMILR